MKNYFNIILIVLLSVSLITTSVLISKTVKQAKELKLKASNIEVLNSKLQTYRNSLNQSVAKIRSITYTNAEYKAYKQEDIQTIKQLNIRLKNALNTTNVNTVIETRYKSKLIYTPKDTCFSFKDNYSTVNGCINNNYVVGTTTNKDSLFLVVHTEYTKRFWFIKYGLKVSNVTAKAANPNTTITGLQFIEIKKN